MRVSSSLLSINFMCVGNGFDDKSGQHFAEFITVS